MPGLSPFEKFWMMTDPQIAMALRGSPFACVDGYLYPCSVRLGTGGRCRMWPDCDKSGMGQGLVLSEVEIRSCCASLTWFRG